MLSMNKMNMLKKMNKMIENDQGEIKSVWIRWLWM